ADSRTPRALLHNQTVVVVTNTRAEGPVMKAHEILRERGFFAILSATAEIEYPRRVRIELRRIGNLIIQSLANGAEIAFAAEFELVRPVMGRDRTLHVTFEKAAILIGENRRGQRIRPEIGRYVAHHPP